MAFTTPASYSVGEIVTAAKLNTHVRDNIRYLKGLDGPTLTSDDVGVGETSTPQSDSVSVNRALSVSTAASPGVSAINIKGTRTGSDASYALLAGVNLGATGADKRGGQIGFYRDTIADSGQVVISSRNASGALTDYLYVKRDGRVGIGISAPGGNLEVRPGAGTPGGLLHYSASAIGGSTVTLIPDGAGDVVNGYCVTWHVKRTGSTYQVGGPTFTATPGAGSSDTAIWTDGGTNALVVRIASTGALTLVRSVGTSTFDVNVLIQWL